MLKNVVVHSKRRFVFTGKAVIVLLLTILISQCLPKDKNEDPAQGTSKFTVMSNAKDPQILTAKTSDGETINVFGSRDEKGTPKRIDQIAVIDAYKKEQVFFLDESTRPTKIFADNGTTFYLNWLSEKRFALTVISKDKSTQINTEVDLTKEQNQPKSLGIETQYPNQVTRKSKLNLSYPSLISFEPEEGKGLDSETACNLFVKQCGLPTDADVWIEIRSVGGLDLLRKIYPSKTSTGVYQGLIPNDLAPATKPNEICKSIVTLLDNMSMIGTGALATLGVAICYQLNLALSSKISQTTNTEMTTACAKIVTALLLYRTTLGNKVAPGAPSLASQLCNSDFLNVSMGGNVEITGGVRAFPSDKLSAKKVVPGQGPYPDIVIDLGSKTVLNSFTLVPSTPGYDQDYNAIAKVSCLQPGTKITISMIGSDGYTDETSYTIKEFAKDGEFDLTVAGADVGVRDTCTVRITLPDGTVLTMTASLVFG